MKDHQLLDAIGGIDEHILAEAETAPVNSKKPVRRFLLVAAVVSVVSITAVAAPTLLSRPIQGSEIVTGETVFPFSMDEEGNIITEGAHGLKVTMDVTVNSDAPAWIEDLYVLNPGEKWNYHGGSGSGDRYNLYTKETIWRQPGMEGELRLHQSVAEFYTDALYGHNCVDTLPGLDSSTGVTIKTVIVGNIEALRVSIPALPDYTGTQYCTGGETRLYWTDGDYMLHLDYPYWVTDAQVESMLESITTQAFVSAIPQDYGTINPESIRQRLPYLSIGMDNGTSCANNTAGLGYAAYGDGSIYLAGLENAIYRYDLATGKTEKILLAAENPVSGHLMVTDQYILYTDAWSDLFALKKDGTTEVPVYQGLGSAQLYAEGTTLYSSSGILDLDTGKVQNWPEGVHTYFVDDSYIYAVKEGGSHCYLRAPKGTMDFEEIPVGFYPIKVLSFGDTLYMTEGGSWTVIRIHQGQEDRLPIRALEYQVLGQQLIYRDEDSGGRVLKSYDLETGEIQTLCEKVFNFSILEDRYICVFCADGQENYYTLIDRQTGSVSQIEQ